MGKLTIDTSHISVQLNKIAKEQIVSQFIVKNKSIIKDTITQKNLKVAKEFVDNVIEKVITPQVPVTSGRLRNSIHGTVEFNKQKQTIVVTIRCGWFYAKQVPYAMYILEGTKAHTIPQGGSASGLILKFKGGSRVKGTTRGSSRFTKKLNTDVYVRSVYVRGVRANNFLIKGIDFIGRNLGTVLVNGLSGIKYKLR
jgi:hypothetical protein